MLNSTAASLRARGLTRRCPGIEPVFPNKDQAIDYAQNRACFRSGEIQISIRDFEVSYGHAKGVDLISDVLPFGRLWHGEPNAISNAIGYAEHFSRSHDAIIRVYDAAGNVIHTHEHKGDFKEW